jgi:uncharacterized membrane protein YagU involved in acid resistance
VADDAPSMTQRIVTAAFQAVVAIALIMLLYNWHGVAGWFDHHYGATITRAVHNEVVAPTPRASSNEAAARSTTPGAAAAPRPMVAR